MVFSLLCHFAAEKAKQPERNPMVVCDDTVCEQQYGKLCLIAAWQIDIIYLQIRAWRLATPSGSEVKPMRITLHIGIFTVTIIVKKRKSRPQAR